MPHMSPMEWMSMFIGSWLILNLILNNSDLYYKIKMKKMNKLFYKKNNYWNWQNL